MATNLTTIQVQLQANAKNFKQNIDTAGKSLNRYITEAIKNKTPPPGGRHTDQSYMNHWRAQNISLAYTLPFKWNFMVGFHKESFESASFVHFAGGQGRTLLVRNKDIIK